MNDEICVQILSATPIKTKNHAKSNACTPAGQAGLLTEIYVHQCSLSDVETHEVEQDKSWEGWASSQWSSVFGDESGAGQEEKKENENEPSRAGPPAQDGSSNYV